MSASVSLYRNHDAERISTRPVDPGYYLQYFLDLSHHLLTEQIFDMTRSRRVMLGRHLIRESKKAYRCGVVRPALEGFSYASELGDITDADESLLYRMVRSVSGYPSAERLRSLMHQVFHAAVLVQTSMLVLLDDLSGGVDFWLPAAL